MSDVFEFIYMCLYSFTCVSGLMTYLNTKTYDFGKTNTNTYDWSMSHEWMSDLNTKTYDWSKMNTDTYNWGMSHEWIFFLYIYTKVYDWSMWFKYKWFEYKHIWLR